MRARLFILLMVILPPSAKAQAVREFCQAAKSAMHDDDEFATAAKSVFPRATFVSRDDTCIYPIKLLHYGDADVLMTAGNAPGEGCHGCGATLSAYVLQRAPTGPRLIAKFVGFDSLGSSGSVADIKACRIAGDDAFAVEAGGTFQGYSSTQVSFYLFRAGGLDHVSPPLPLSADDSGAMTDDKKAVSIDGAWHIEAGRPDSVTIGYKVEAKGRTTETSATWRLEQNQLKLTAGRVPAEFDAASGN